MYKNILKLQSPIFSALHDQDVQKYFKALEINFFGLAWVTTDTKRYVDDDDDDDVDNEKL